MKSSEPIRVKINTLRGRDWPKAGHCCLEFRAHVGARTLIRALICRDPTSKIRPCQVLLCYWSSCRNQLLPPSLPLFPPRLVFPSERKGNIPLASLMGSRGQQRRRWRRANSDRTFRTDPFNDPKIRKQNDVDMIFKSASTSVGEELTVVSFLLPVFARRLLSLSLCCFIF